MYHDRPRINIFFLTLTLGLTALSVAASASAAEPPITTIVFTPDQQSILVGSQSGIRQLSWPDLQLQRRLKTGMPNLHTLAFSPNRSRLAVGGGYPSELGEVTILQWPSAETLDSLRYHDDSVMALVWLDDKTLVSGALDRDVIKWKQDAESTWQRSELSGHSRGVTSLVVLRSASLILSAGIDRSLRVWNADSEELIRSLRIHTLPIHDLAERPEQPGLPMVASASQDKTVRFWQPTIGRMVRFIRLDSVPQQIAWLPGGSKLVAACQDGSLRLIDPDTVTVTATYSAIDGWAYALAIAPDGRSAVVGGAGGNIQVIKF